MRKNTAIFATGLIAGIGTSVLWQHLTPEDDPAVEVVATEPEPQILAPLQETEFPTAQTISDSVPISSPPPFGPEVSAAARALLPAGAVLPGDGPGPEVAKRLWLSNYPDLQQMASLSEEELETLSQLLGRSARVAEYVAELGMVKYLDMRKHVDSVEANRQVDGLNTSLSAADNGLRDDQIRSLVSAMAVERRREGELVASRSYLTTNPYEILSLEEDRVRIAEESDRRIVEAAKFNLNEVQLSALQNSLRIRTSRMRQIYEAQRMLLTPDGQNPVTSSSNGD